MVAPLHGKGRLDRGPDQCLLFRFIKQQQQRWIIVFGGLLRGQCRGHSCGTVDADGVLEGKRSELLFLFLFVDPGRTDLLHMPFFVVDSFVRYCQPHSQIIGVCVCVFRIGMGRSVRGSRERDLWGLDRYQGPRCFRSNLLVSALDGGMEGSGGTENEGTPREHGFY